MTVFVDDQEVNLRFLALSSVGYQQLMKLSTAKMQGRKLGQSCPSTWRISRSLCLILIELSR